MSWSIENEHTEPPVEHHKNGSKGGTKVHGESQEQQGFTHWLLSWGEMMFAMLLSKHEFNPMVFHHDFLKSTANNKHLLAAKDSDVAI